MNLENAPISAGGAGQFPDPNAINGMSPFFPPANINCPSDHAGGHAQLPQALLAIANSSPLIEGGGPYSAFDLLVDKHHTLIKSEKLAWHLFEWFPSMGLLTTKKPLESKWRTPGLLALTNVENSLQLPLSRMLTSPLGRHFRCIH